MNIIGSLGDMLAPISILILGFQLAEYPFLEIFKNKFVYLVTACRLLVLPLFILLVFYLLGISGMHAAVAVILLALPSGTLNVILSKQYKCAPEFATQSVVQGNIFMMFSLPLIMMLVTKVLL